MPINELASVDDARQKLTQLFVSTAEDAVVPEHLGNYLELLSILCAFPKAAKFEDALEGISSDIWVEYNAGVMPGVRSRFSRAIINLAAYQYGYSCQDNVVFSGPVAGKDFGERVRGKVLWKDSFALGHGEFSHSYQWLSVGRALRWGSLTAAVYSSTADILSVEPIFHVSNGKLELALIPLWEWMVDCTLYDPKYDAEVGKAVDDYVAKQLKAWCAKRPTHRFFIASFIKTLDENIIAQRGQPGLEARFLDEYMAEINFYKSTLRARYRGLSALTATTCRSANNVTTLVRKNNTWFINLYERHRTGFGDVNAKQLVNPQDIDLLPKGKLQKAQDNGQAQLLNLFASQRGVPQQGAPLLKAKEVDGLQRGRRPRDMNAVAPAYAAHGATFTSAHPIEGIKADRMQSYGAKGWATPKKYVYEQAYDITALGDEAARGVGKAQRPAVFHDLKGSVSATLPMDAISLLK